MRYRREGLKKWVLAAGLQLVLAVQIQGGQVSYVDDDAPAGGDGQSWETAYRFLQDALVAAQPGCGVEEIHIAQGSYRPDRDEVNPGGTGDREAAFVPPDGVAVMGGYAGLGSADPDARDVALYETILSGDLLGDDEPGFVGYEENSNHVLHSNEEGTTVMLEGVTVTGGNADLSDYPAGYGAGMSAVGTNLSIEQCTFIRNSALTRGGGLYIRDGVATLEDCTFADNRVAIDKPSSVNRGGGACFSDSAVSATHCKFVGNRIVLGGKGGGLYNDHSNTDLVGCLFEQNMAEVGGGAYMYGEMLTVNGCFFTGNAAEYGGGFYHNVGIVTVTDSVFNDNVAEQRGGGLFFDASIVVADSLIVGNSAAIGGGIYSVKGVSTLLNSRVESNSAAAGGGLGIFSGNLEVENCEITANSALFGAGIYLENGGLDSIENSLLKDNEATLDGGGMCIIRCSPVLIECALVNNWANEGGGLYNQFGTPMLTECEFISNDAWHGGGILNEYADAVIEWCLFAHNDGEEGGAMYNRDSSPSVLNCRFEENRSTSDGGAIWNLRGFPGRGGANAVKDQGGRSCKAVVGDRGGPSFVNCLFFNNMAWGIYGSSMLNDDSSPSIINCTFAENVSDIGDIYNTNSFPTVENSILDHGYNPIVDEDGSSTTVRYSISGYEWEGEGEGNIVGKALFADPHGDFRPLPGSPCIDAGDNGAVPEGIDTDLRGEARFHDNVETEDTGLGSPPIVDMGAYENQSIPCPEDLTGSAAVPDGVVDVYDLLVLLAQWGTAGLEGDITGVTGLPDGIVDVHDLLALLAAWGPCD